MSLDIRGLGEEEVDYASLCRTVVGMLAESPAWQSMSLWGDSGNAADEAKHLPIPEQGEVVEELVSSFLYRILEFRSDAGADSRVSASIARMSGGLDFSMSCAGGELERWASDWIDLCVDVAVSIHRSMGEEYELEEGRFMTHGMVTPPPGTPRFMSHPGRAVRFYCRRHYEQAGKMKVFDRYRTAPLPSEATRTEHGDLLVIRWAPDLVDLDRLERGLSAEHAWLRTPKPPRPTGPAGDGPVLLAGARPAAPLTLYVPIAATGYKAMVPEADGSLDVETVEELQSLLAQGRVPGGGELKHIVLICPSRESAIAARKAALASGFRGTVYSTNEGELRAPQHEEASAS